MFSIILLSFESYAVLFSYIIVFIQAFQPHSGWPESTQKNAFFDESIISLFFIANNLAYVK